MRQRRSTQSSLEVQQWEKALKNVRRSNPVQPQVACSALGLIGFRPSPRQLNLPWTPKAIGVQGNAKIARQLANSESADKKADPSQLVDFWTTAPCMDGGHLCDLFNHQVLPPILGAVQQLIKLLCGHFPVETAKRAFDSALDDDLLLVRHKANAEASILPKRPQRIIPNQTSMPIRATLRSTPKNYGSRAKQNSPLKKRLR